MDKLDILLSQTRPLYFKRKRNRRLAAAASILSPCVVALFLSFWNFSSPQSLIYDVWSDEIYQAQCGSIIEDYGLPVDEYGLLKVV